MHAPASPPPSAHPRWLGSLVAIIGGGCALLGFLVLVGWHLHLPAMVQLRPTLAPMQYNTAVCFVFAGIGLATWRGPKAVPPVLGAVIAFVSGLTFYEYVCQADFGIDQALFHSYISTGTTHLGRMSPVSALSFTLAGLALLFLGLRITPRWRLLVAGSLASVVISISFVAILGYILGLPGTYGWGNLTRVAMHTAVGLGFLGAGLLTATWQTALRPGERTPRWLPIPLGLAVFTASLVLYFALESKQDEEIVQTVKVGAESAKNQISVRLDARIRSFVRMARHWESSGIPTQAAWEADATDYVKDLPDLQALEWIDNARLVRWIVPLQGNESKLNRNLTEEKSRNAAVERAEREHQPIITPIVTLFRGGLGFIVYVPITVEGKPQGFIVAVFNAQTCLQRYLPDGVAAGEAVRLSEGRTVFYERAAATPPAREQWRQQEEIELKGANWNLAMWPTPALAARLDSPLPRVVLVAGCLGSLLLGAVCFYAQRSSRQASETARINAALQTALDEVKTLEGLLPICCGCKRVRDDTGYWSQIESYLHRHTDASFSHGYCPECAAKAFTDYGFAVPERIQTELAAKNFD